MKRRNFLKGSLIGGSALSFGSLNWLCTSVSEDKNNTENENTLNSNLKFTEFELNEYTIADLQKMMHNNALSSKDITQKYIDRIKRIDKNGPKLNSVIEINPDAIEIAKKLDKERKNGNLRGPLHGIPILIKDNIDTGDKMHTTAGSLAFKDSIAKKDAFIVKKLREAGAVLLGKTNLSEWANFRSYFSSSGWSSLGGQVRNPYLLNRTPCGSSSGTAVAVSANLCSIGIGTETDGSIVCPASINGVVGIKPTLGIWSRTGIVPIAFSQDTAGPIARTVSDAAILLEALTAVDKKDSESKKIKKYIDRNYTKALDSDGLKGARIGVLRSFFGFDKRVDVIMEESIKVIKNEGAEIIDNLKFESRREAGDAEWIVLIYEFKHYLNKYLDEHPEIPYRSLEELIEFNKKNAEKVMPWFDQEIFVEAQKCGDLTDKKYLKALKTAKHATQGTIDNLCKQYNLDALIAPTNAPAWVIDWINGDNYKGGSSSLAAISGYPSITVPAGFVHDLPIGISFIGKAYSETKLIKLAYSFEANNYNRKTPEFKTGIEL